MHKRGSAFALTATERSEVSDYKFCLPSFWQTRIILFFMCLSPLVIKHPYTSLVPPSSYSIPRDVSWSSYAFDRASKISSVRPFMLVPCGRCHECRRARGSQWRLRLFHEYITSLNKNNLFVTLTISPEYYDFYKDNPNLAVRRFSDYVRKTYGKGMRYFLVTEIGKEGRLHFHGILFNVPFVYRFKTNSNEVYFKQTNQKLRKSWKIGNTWCGYVDIRTIKYVTKYITKVDELHPDFFGRVYCSPGIGGKILTPAQISDIRLNHKWNSRYTFHLEGKPRIIPRYYLSKAFTPWELQLFSVRRESVPVSWPKVIKGILYDSPVAYLQAQMSRISQIGFKSLGIAERFINKKRSIYFMGLSPSELVFRYSLFNSF